MELYFPWLTYNINTNLKTGVQLIEDHASIWRISGIDKSVNCCLVIMYNRNNMLDDCMSRSD